MGPIEFDMLTKATFEEIENLLNLKGGEYSGEADRLENFKRNAKSVGLHPLQVWAIYAGKHWDAIGQFVRDQARDTHRTRLESIEGRFDDLIAYCILGKALIKEADEARQGLRG